MLSIEITRSGETHQRLAGSRWSDQCQSEGHILVDGHDSSRDRLRTLREVVAFVRQDVIVPGQRAHCRSDSAAGSRRARR